MKRFFGPVVAVLLSAPLSAAQPITGQWVTATRDAVVEIAPCGARLCGTIARFMGPRSSGADPRDVNNADPAKRGRRILGLAILTGFVADGDVWRGQIYDPRSGKTYRSILRRKGSGTLEVKGCLGPFCQTQLWNRAP